MSLRDAIQFVSSIDPRIDINNLHNKMYAILKSGNRANYWQFPIQGTPGAATQLNWNTTVPDESTYVNRRCYVNLTGTITFQGASAGAGQTLLQCRGYNAAAGVSVGNANFDALRCLPLSQLFQNFNVTLNNNAITQNLGLYSRIFQRFQRTYKDQNLDLSMSPASPDMSLEYSDLFGSYLDPFNVYGTQQYDPRGAFTGITVTSNTSLGANDTATVTFNITEPFWLSPFAWDQNGEPVSLQGIRNFNVSAQLGGRGNSAIAGAAGSMWSHSTAVGAGTITGAQVAITSGSLFLSYISPPPDQFLPRNSYYSWVNPTYYQQTVGGANAGVQIRQNSQTIQLDSVPARMYIWVEKADFLQDMTKTDTTGFRIDNIAIRWDTVASILNDATSQDLYQMSVRNGCNITWNQWNGCRVPDPSTPGATLPSGLGSILCCNFGLDIPLVDGQAPGVTGKHTLQVTVTATNITGGNIPTASVNILICEEGVMNINNGNIQFSTGIVTTADYKSVDQMVPISHMPSKNILGGAFWDDVKAFISRAGPGVFRAIKSVLPGVVQNAGEAVLQAYGKGLGRVKGGAMLTGPQLAQLE